ncbi:hypothetical protein TNCV_4023301 [Trichonephila clavipes]|nr:hypothetical protein TNCV_4023301 [Trichonephila clavipes]
MADDKTSLTSSAVGSLVVRASDSRPEDLGSMPDATKHPPSTHGFTCRNCGGGDRGRVAIYRPFGEFRRAKSYCHLYGAQGQRQSTSCPYPDEFHGPRSDCVRQFDQTRGMPNLPSEIIPDMLDWRQIWGSGRPRKGSNRAEIVLGHPYRARPSIAMLKNGSWESLHEWQHMWLQDVVNILLDCHGATDQY